jgi:hypothetical protein
VFTNLQAFSGEFRRSAVLSIKPSQLTPQAESQWVTIEGQADQNEKPMTLLDATPPKPERPIWRYILIAVAAAIVIGVTAYVLWDYPEQRAVTHFMQALERGDYQTAYRIWQPSPSYSFDDFMKDWGPKGDYGKVTSFDILDASSASAKTVTILVVVNNETPAVKLLVDRKTKGLAYSPY